MLGAKLTMNRKNGFTLIEILVATILIGLAVTALIGANQAFTSANGVAVELSTAEFLIEQIRERLATREYIALGAFDDASFSPPIDIAGQQLSDFSGFTQQITVENVNATNFDQVVVDNASSFVRITVKILCNNREISSVSWLRAEY